MKYKTKDFESNCCKAPVKLQGYTTHYHSCTKCGKSCDSKLNKGKV